MSSPEEKRFRSRKEIYGGLISKEVAQQLEDMGTDIPSGLEKAEIDYVRVKVAEGPIGSISERIGKVTEIAVEQKAMVEGIISTIVLITYGPNSFYPILDGKWKHLVEMLLSRCGKEIGIVEGRQETLAGRCGSSTQMKIGSIIRDILGLLKELDGVEYGMSKEIGSGNETMRD